MSAEQWNLMGLSEMVSLASARVNRRKFELFTLWLSHVLRPYLRDRRSVAAVRFADLHINDWSAEIDEREQHLRDARQAVIDIERWVKEAPTSAETRRRRVYLNAAHVAQQSLGNNLPNGGVVASAKLAAFAFGWANEDYAKEQFEFGDPIRDAHVRLQEAMFREIVGNPFDTIEFEPRWRTDDVMGIVRGIDRTSDFRTMPILSDALMDAGCEDERIIQHCRTSQPHVRGCWLVDLILERS